MKEKIQPKRTILVCLSSSPSCQSIIKAANQSKNKEDHFLALYVGSKERINTDNSLQSNIDLVKSYGGEVHIIESNEIVLSIVEFAKRMGVTDLFIGSSAPSHSLFAARPIGEQLASYLTNISIYIIPNVIASDYPVRIKNQSRFLFNSKDIFIVLGIMAIATLLSMWFDQSRFSNGNIITIYILAVLLASISTGHQIYGILAASLYILLFNFLFIEPRFTLFVYDSEYLMTYFVSFLAAFITGSLASKLKTVATSSAENAYRAKVLLDTSNQLESATNRHDLIHITCTQLSRLLDRPIYYFDVGTQIHNVFACNGEELPLLNEQEIDTEVILYTAKNRHHAGAFTNNYQDCPKRYYSIHNNHNFYGVIGIDMKGKNFNEFENTILLSILNEFTLALENETMLLEKQEALIQSEKATFRSTLLRSISHDLRTPLTTISGNAETLLMNGNQLQEQERNKIYHDIHEDAMWLKQEMENILAMTKVESNEYLNETIESVEDIIAEALKHCEKDDQHHLVVEPILENLFVRADMKLIVLVLVNLLNNAFKYTPKGSTITIQVEEDIDKVWIAVKDNGNGIPKGDKEHIFDLFYTGEKKIADSYRSMGIGLNYCYLTMKAHGQEIEVLDNVPHGTIFRFSLAKEKLNEK